MAPPSGGPRAVRAVAADPPTELPAPRATCTAKREPGIDSAWWCPTRRCHRLKSPRYVCPMDPAPRPPMGTPACSPSSIHLVRGRGRRAASSIGSPSGCRHAEGGTPTSWVSSARRSSMRASSPKATLPPPATATGASSATASTTTTTARAGRCPAPGRGGQGGGAAGQDTIAAGALLEKNDVDVVVDALEEHLTLKGDDLALLGGAESSNQGLEDVRHIVVVEKDPKLHRGLAFYHGAQPLDLDHELRNLLVHVHRTLLI
mmetsp:Transcript_28364/g.90377  ORF Transcript_28364/g.90377 Transcript_28364/m.90377 type:complete len:261 (+) Transcript_28364:1399-2181(+)